MAEISYDTRKQEMQALRRKRKRRQSIIRTVLTVVLIAAVVLGIKVIAGESPSKKVDRLAKTEIPDWIDSQIMPAVGTSRRAENLEDVKGIVVHYVGNPGTTAQNNRDYYDNVGVEVNSHFVVGLEGEIIQCIPLNEKSSASNHRNRDTISIEVCHPDETGKFTDVTYEALVKLTAWLCETCDFDEEDIIRHYDVTGKMCPLYFVEHEDAWLQFKKDVMGVLK